MASSPSLPRLHFIHSTRASKVVWLSRSLGANVELIEHTWESIKSPEFLKLNPHGTIPTLETNSSSSSPMVLWESGAILYWLLETYDQENRYYGSPGSEKRNLFHLWNAFVAECENVVVTYFIHTQWLPEEKRDKKIAATMKENWDNKISKALLALLTTQRSGKFVVGDELSATDFALSLAVEHADLCGLLDGEAMSPVKKYAEALYQSKYFRDSFYKSESK
eukprot:CAMPEP_0201479992 /NCGR_PEP_ID=MMETSP0151_2-20130828/4602_1 /ASSEMBLY_ACC=CAM_ASM_000257 /TAXON_ID=200890 /ORGANISM="Paramoeba atlantica, Strain 621/1 / CCAP 1560/9" /LENGTH=221 /DNA_ID=CAMNT_0047861733 /DNA_START=45 /DNA_END=710 /DNA_ORIENTATION=+